VRILAITAGASIAAMIFQLTTTLTTFDLDVEDATLANDRTGIAYRL